MAGPAGPRHGRGMTTTAAPEDTAAILLANAEKADQQSRLTADAVAALRRCGALALATPTAHGGAGASAGQLARRLAELGRACPSAAWIAGTCATSKTFLTANFCGAEPAEAFADPDALACGSGAPAGRGERTAGGVRITGRWASVSGCQDADWAHLALMVDDVYSWAFIPAGELTVEQTWQMAGMRGTGSHTVAADGVTVPARWVTPGAAPAAAELIVYKLTALAPVVGAAHGALDVITAMFASGRRPYNTSYTKMAESPGARHWLAEAAHLAGRAGQTMMAAAGAAERGDLTGTDAARLFMDLAGAGRDCRAATEQMLDLHGASGFATASPLQRYWRDISVGSRHPLLNPYLAVERLGAELAG